MKQSIVLLGVSLLVFCTSRSQNEIKEASYKIQENDHYELLIPEENQTGVLILFGGFPDTPDVIKQEFKIIEPATDAGIAVALMKFNRKLWLMENEKNQLATIVSQMFAENDLTQENVYIGGFSSGGNISLLLGNYLVESGSDIQPEGVFIVDSPVDLLRLYKNAQRNIERNFMPSSVQESRMTVSILESAFGKPEDGIKPYEEHSPYTSKTHNIDNLKYLQNAKLRLYTEPDTVWWKENRQYEYEDMNAYFIKNLADDLTEEFGNIVEYIATKNRGYRPNGNRHPHSWSIVDVDELIQWITNE
ncbi:MAG: hypothetical protein AAF992_27050 [Bacteroidota bacterium]